MVQGGGSPIERGTYQRKRRKKRELALGCIEEKGQLKGDYTVLRFKGEGAKGLTPPCEKGKGKGVAL